MVYTAGNGEQAYHKLSSAVVMRLSLYRIFIVCGVSTIAAGLLGFLIIPASPRHTARPWWPQGWLSDREADVYMARLIRDDPLKGASSTMNIKWADMSVLPRSQLGRVTCTDHIMDTAALSWLIGVFGLIFLCV